jgi:hypothetical protein
MKIDYSRYVISFIITVAIFLTAFYISNSLSNKKVDVVQNIQEDLAIDILSNETQFDILREAPCSNLNYSILSDELSELGNKLSVTENELGSDDPKVLYLKKYYYLLEIKDYLLSKKIADKCASQKQAFIIYFYANKNCDNCEKQGYNLTRLREIYPDIKVYTFDFDTDLSAIDAIKKVFKLKSEFPIMIIEDKAYYGFKDIDSLESLLPASFKVNPNATSTATTTQKSTTTKAASSTKLK